MSDDISVNKVSWKDISLVQIVSSVQMNENNNILTKTNLHNAPPLKHFRKEIQFIKKPINSSKLGMKIYSIEKPGGISGTSETVFNSTLATFSYEKDISHEKLSETCVALTSIQTNTLNRIRNTNKIKSNYCVDTEQYLQKKGISIEQSQFSYLRSGNSAVKPDTLGSSSKNNNNNSSIC